MLCKSCQALSGSRHSLIGNRIEQDPDIPKPQPSPIRGDFDGRRVISLNQVSTDTSVPVQTA